MGLYLHLICVSEERASTDQNANYSDRLCAEHAPDQGQNGINGGQPVGRHRLCRIWTGTGGCGALWDWGVFGICSESVASTVDRDDFGMMEQTIKDGAGCRNIV